MRCFAHRYYWSADKKADGVYRILCLGDSVLYGQGITYFETLTYKLEEFLNARIYGKEIETVNLGQSGFSIYDEWLQYTRWAKNMDPDMVIISLSNNDLELYRLPGERVTQTYWENGSIHLQYFKLVFEHISEFCEKTGIPVIIAFFEFNDNDIKQKAWSAIKELCENHGIDLINISNGIEKDFLYDEHNLLVNKTDGHPSAYASEKAALRLGEKILEKGYLDQYIKPDADVKKLFRQLAENSAQSYRHGNRPEISLFRLNHLFEEKYKKPALSNIIEPETLNDLLKIKNEVSHVYHDSLKVLFLEAYAQVLINDSPRIYDFLYNIDMIMTRLAKNIFIHTKNLEHKNLAYFPYNNITKSSFNTKVISKLTSVLNRWISEFEESKEKFLNNTVSAINELEVYTADINTRKTVSGLAINKIWDNALVLIGNFAQLLLSIEDLYNKYKPELFTQEPGRTFIGLLDDSIKIFEQIEVLIEVLNLKKIVSLNNFDIDKPVCNFLISLKSNAPKAQLRVQLNSHIPYYQTITESHWLIRDDQPHIYKSQFPLFALGNIQLLIYGHGNIDFEYLKIFINENRQITLNKDNFRQTGDNTFESGLIFTTV